MKPDSRRGGWAITWAALIGSAAAVTALPGVRSAVAAHASLAFGREPEWLRAAWGSARPALEPGLQQAVSRSSADVELQIGAATLPVAHVQTAEEQHQAGAPRERVVPAILARLDTLARRFPGDASVRAHQLRYLSWRDVWIPRPGPASLAVLPFPRCWAWKRAGPSQRAIRAFGTAARAGAELEPDNAYFPTMEAARAFAAGTDQEGLRFLHAAAQKPRWDDHVIDETRAQWRLLAAAYGERGAVQKAYPALRLLFAHFTLAETTAYLATWHARRSEQSGDFERSVRIRHDVMQIGMRIAESSPRFTSREMGSAVFGIGDAGLTPPPPDIPNLLGDPTAYQRAADPYPAQLVARGHAPEADWIQEQSTRLRAIRDQIQPSFQSGEATWHFERLVPWWLTDILLLRMVYALLLLWLVARLLSFGQGVALRDRKSPPTVVWLLFCLGLLIAPAIRLLDRVAIQTVWDQLDIAPILRLAAALILIWTPAPLLARVFGHGQVPNRWRTALGWATVIVIAVSAPFTLVAASAPEPRVMVSLILGLTLSGLLWLSRRAGQQEDRSSARPRWKPIVPAVISILPTLFFLAATHDRGAMYPEVLPDLMQASEEFAAMRSVTWFLVLLPAGLLIFLQLCRVAALGISLRTGMPRGLRQTTPYAIAMLMSLYFISLIPTALADRTAESQLDRLITERAAPHISGSYHR